MNLWKLTSNFQNFLLHANEKGDGKFSKTVDSDVTVINAAFLSSKVCIKTWIYE